MVTELHLSKRVCVIGAGPSGLVGARELRKEGHNVVVLEQNHDIGGQWLYEPNVDGEDSLGRSKFLKVHSSLYESVRLLSPRETMGFSDFPFLVKAGRDTRRFPGHREFWLYLKDFCDYFGLRDMIMFNSRVEYVGMLDYGESGKDLKWVVKYRQKNNESLMEDVFDSVVVASGHYTHPRLPSFKGMDAWKRKQMHSHIYRVPEPFRDEIVVIVGTSTSGQDLCMELVEVAKEVHISSKPSNITEGLSKLISKRNNLHLHPLIQSLHEDGRVLFIDGSSVVADTILYCTGYSYAFPFLETKGIVGVEDDRVGPLFEHTFPPSLAPSLSFIGIPRKVIGLPFFESQAKWIAQLLCGKRKLPSRDEMMQSVMEFYEARDAAAIPKRNTHDIADFQYCDKYAEYGGFPHLEEWRKELCISAIINSEENLETFRDSWDDDELLQKALQASHFTQLPFQDLLDIDVCL